MGNETGSIYDEDTAIRNHTVQDLEGDRQSFGVVYYGTNGRGLHYGAR